MNLRIDEMTSESDRGGKEGESVRRSLPASEPKGRTPKAREEGTVGKRKRKKEK